VAQEGEGDLMRSRDRSAPEAPVTAGDGRLIKFSLGLPAEQVAELDAMARQQYSSRGAVLRQMVDLGMAQRRRQVQLAEWHQARANENPSE
jgi:hypothetical protein